MNDQVLFLFPKVFTFWGAFEIFYLPSCFLIDKIYCIHLVFIESWPSYWRNRRIRYGSQKPLNSVPVDKDIGSIPLFFPSSTSLWINLKIPIQGSVMNLWDCPVKEVYSSNPEMNFKTIFQVTSLSSLVFTALIPLLELFIFSLHTSRD